MEFFHILNVIQRELLLFAVIGFLIGGADDLVVDLIWLGRSLWRRLTVYSRHQRANLRLLTASIRGQEPTSIAILIPLWDEADVAGPMLRHALKTIQSPYVRIFAGCYPNDRATLAAVQSVAHTDPRLILVRNSAPGPTTKADCLNALWSHLVHLRAVEGQSFRTIILHDAEDVIDPAEIPLFDYFGARFDFIQIPVMPLPDARSRWISGHYCDEFSEAHAKALVVREAVGAGLPAAGVGCGFSTQLLTKIAVLNGGLPFKANSLTEDYELGLTARSLGATSAFIRIPALPGGAPVAVRAHFPSDFESAVKQKARWMAGIALLGWQSLGWQGNLAERWMRARDRRAPLAALILFTAYLCIILTLGRLALSWIVPIPPFVPGNTILALLLASQFMLVWRLLVRACFVGMGYGWKEALRSIPRAVIANAIAIVAAQRAISIYIRQRISGKIVWDKTSHIFPHLTGETV